MKIKKLILMLALVGVSGISAGDVESPAKDTQPKAKTGKLRSPWLWFGSGAILGNKIANHYFDHPNSTYATSINSGVKAMAPMALAAWSYVPARDSKAVKIMGGTIALTGLAGILANIKMKNPINLSLDYVMGRLATKNALRATQEHNAWVIAEKERQAKAGTNVPFNRGPINTEEIEKNLQFQANNIQVQDRRSVADIDFNTKEYWNDRRQKLESTAKEVFQSQFTLNPRQYAKRLAEFTKSREAMEKSELAWLNPEPKQKKASNQYETGTMIRWNATTGHQELIENGVVKIWDTQAKAWLNKS